MRWDDLELADNELALCKFEATHVMSDWYYVKNWWKFQHYRDRNPPWIKLHRGFFSDPDIAGLSDSDQLRLLRLWLSSADHEGRIPLECRIISRLIGLARLDLTSCLLARLEAKGLISKEDIRGSRLLLASKVLATDRDRDRDRDREEKEARAPARNADSRVAPEVAFRGKLLTVYKPTDEAMRQAYPQLDAGAEYLRADAWMVAHPGRRKGTAAFVTSWFARSEQYLESRIPPEKWSNYGFAERKPSADEIIKRNVETTRQFLAEAGRVVK